MLAPVTLKIFLALTFCRHSISHSFDLQKTLKPLGDCKDIVGVGFDLTAGYG